MKTLSEYKQQTSKATTKEELHEISYEAFIQDAAPIDSAVFCGAKPRTLSDKVDALCIKREMEFEEEKV